MLWLALHFPLLPLEALDCPCTSEDAAGPAPAAVVLRGRIVVADRAAAEAGVEAGMRLSGALGLAPRLRTFERDPGREAAALQRLACWAGQFTPQVCLLPPAGLLLEIGGCLRLFGGLPRLHEAVRAGAAGQGASLRTAVAPTPLGATWLAWWRDGAVCPDLPDLHGMLADLPLHIPAWDEAVRRRLEAFGMHRLSEVLALPRPELGRRIGATPMAELARALGEVPDPRPAFAFPEKFAQTIELPARVDAAPMLVFAGQRLLAAACGWLAARGAGTALCRFVLCQEGGAAQTLALRSSEPGRDESRWLRLLRERLERCVLSAPVQALALCVDEPVPLSGASAPLFEGEQAAGEGALACLDRLRARLGEAGVHTLAALADYRPECATGRADPAASPKRRHAALPENDGEAVPAAADLPAAPPTRPLWLLPQPRPLAEIGGRPHWEGRLELLAGPERLESGWWDEGEQLAEATGSRPAAGDVRRDYFVAGNPHGQRLWVFRNAEGWFLHGLFA